MAVDDVADGRVRGAHGVVLEDVEESVACRKGFFGSNWSIQTRFVQI